MKVLVLAAIAEGATGAPPFGCSELCEMRPTCHSLQEDVAAVFDAPPR